MKTNHYKNYCPVCGDGRMSRKFLGYWKCFAIYKCINCGCRYSNLTAQKG